MRTILLCLLTCLLFFTMPACQTQLYGEPTWDYPANLEQESVADIQVFREDSDITIVNNTPVTYENCRIWINERYARAVSSLPAGSSLTLSLFDFRDASGEIFRGGGFFAGYEPDPVVLVQLQTSDGRLLGLIVEGGNTPE
ncbi:MAG TPA: hypothetical protein ENJ06_04570 [Phycisphaeraceae bacterium]|nr:hypothetical protein [Phycisphaeraceae bacterium]